MPLNDFFVIAGYVFFLLFFLRFFPGCIDNLRAFIYLNTRRKEAATTAKTADYFAKRAVT